MAKYLTKSDYKNGLRCLKYLWIAKNKKELLPSITADVQFTIDQGHFVGQLATNLFPKGILLETDFFKNINDSKLALEKHLPLYEAGFTFNQCYARVDILNPNEDGWDIIEVKSGSSVKEEHLHDVAFQEYVLRNSGLNIKNCYICVLNNEYIRAGELNINSLFKLENVSDKISKYQEGIEERISIFQKVINSLLPIECNLCKNCLGGMFSSECSLADECMKFLPMHNIFDLYNSRKRFELYEQGIVDLSKIPESIKLNENQTVQVHAIKHNKVIINKDNIKQFLSKFKFPLYFLDFETFNLAVPPYDNLKPFQRYPFQYSLHILESEDSELKHISFLGDENKDCRKEFVESLIANLGSKGSIIVYNASFELGVLKEQMQLYPEYTDKLTPLFERVIDLIIPFKEFWYYNPLQKGSCSIKQILPVLTDLDYAQLAIHNGGMASCNYSFIAFGNLVTKELPKAKDIQDIRLNLEKYCELDTYAMYLIYMKLKELVR